MIREFYSWKIIYLTVSQSLTCIFLKFYLFIYPWLCWVFVVSVWGLSLVAATGATLHHGARASHHRGLSRCGAQAPDAQAQQFWLTGPVAPRHVGSSQTRARTRVPCTGRQTLNHCATREALTCILITWLSYYSANSDWLGLGLGPKTLRSKQAADPRTTLE